MDEVQNLKLDIPPRVESGPVRFIYSDGYADHAGLFLRGDDAFGYAMSLNAVLEYLKNAEISNATPELMIARMELEGLLEDLTSCIERPKQ